MRTLLLSLLLCGACSAQTCNLTLATTTAPATSAWYDNRVTLCRTFVATYQASGFSALSFELDGAPCATTSCNSQGTAVPIPSPIQGSNPSTDTGQETLVTNLYYPWIRLNLSAVTGTGTFSATALGYPGLSARTQTIPAPNKVTSVFARIGDVVAVSGDYNTGQVTESGNLYYLDSRARAAISASAPVGYNSGTGVISCPTCNTSVSAPSYFVRQSLAVTASTLAMTINVVSGNYIFLVTGTNSVFPTISDTLGSTWVSVTSASNGGGNFGKMWIAHLASSGADTITATGGTFPNMAAIELIPPSGFTGTADAVNSSTIGKPVSISISQANEFVISAVAMNHTNIQADSLAPIHLAAISNTSDGIAIGYSILPVPSGPVAAGFSYANGGTTSDAVVVAASFK